METDLRWFGVVYMWFGANMAGRRNKNAFKCVLQVLILSQTQPLGIKNVVWGGLEVVWGGLEVVWGGLGCFGVVWGVSTDPLTLDQEAAVSSLTGVTALWALSI